MVILSQSVKKCYHLLVAMPNKLTIKD